MTPVRSDRWLAVAGALAMAAGTASAAASAHVADPHDGTRLASAAQMLLAHGAGLILIMLAGSTWTAQRRAFSWVAIGLLAGLLMFAGSLLLAVFADTSTALAPIGGGLLIASWLLAAGVLWRAVSSNPAG